MARRFRSVQFKIILAVAAIMMVGIAMAITVSTVNQRNNLINAARNTLAVNTEMLNVTVRNLMLAGEAPVAVGTIAGLRDLDAFLEFEVYRSDGTVAFSDYSTLEFVNTYQDMVVFDRTERTDTAVTDQTGFTEALSSNTPFESLDVENRAMDYWFPILNYAECRTCHGDDNFVRGVSHFSVSLDGIYSQVRQAGITLSSFLIALGLVLFMSILFQLRRVIIKPVLAIGLTARAVSDGDLEARTDIDSRDELGDLAGGINGMIVGLRERASLEVEARVTETRLEENRKYLDNIKEGLLLLNPLLRITEQYSSFLEELFGRQDLAGLPIVDLIYPDSDGDSEKRKELEGFLGILFNNRTADMDMIMEINPLGHTQLNVSGRTILVSANYLRIPDEKGEIENVMVIFEDLTDIEKAREELELERGRRENELARISAILRAGPAVFEGFIEEARRSLTGLRENLESLGDDSIAAAAFRDVHSVKGTARYLEFSQIEILAHKLEDLLAEGQDTAFSEPDFIKHIDSLLDELDTELNDVSALLAMFRDFAEGGGPVNELDSLRSRMGRMVQDLATELEIEADFELEASITEIPELPAIQNSLLHILRNAVAHGLEDRFERISAGKTESGIVRLGFSRDASGALTVFVEDDGRGIDMKALEKKGRKAGLLSVDQKLPSQIIGLLFRPGFSSRENVDSISGRGVGLDAVRDDVKRLGGQISVRTNPGKGTRFTLTFPAGGNN